MLDILYQPISTFLKMARICLGLYRSRWAYVGLCWPKKAYMDYGGPKLAKRGIGKTYMDLGRPRGA